MNLFSILPTSHEETEHLVLEPATPATKNEQLLWEKQLLGLYVSDHPLKDFREQLQQISSPITSITRQDEGKVRRLGGLVQSIKRIATRSGASMAFAELHDLSGSIECVVFPKIFESSGHMWRDDVILCVEGKISYKEGRSDTMTDEPKLLVSAVRVVAKLSDKFQPTMSVSYHAMDQQSASPNAVDIEDLDTGERFALKAVPTQESHFEISVPADIARDRLEALQALIRAHQGETICVICLTSAEGKKRRIQLPTRVNVTEKFKKELEACLHPTPA